MSRSQILENPREMFVVIFVWPTGYICCTATPWFEEICFFHEKFPSFILALKEFKHKTYHTSQNPSFWLGDYSYFLYAHTETGGICSKYKRISDGGVIRQRSLNTGIVTLNNYAKRIPLLVSRITFAHEIGHSFGSPVSESSSPPAPRYCLASSSVLPTWPQLKWSPIDPWVTSQWPPSDLSVTPEWSPIIFSDPVWFDEPQDRQSSLPAGQLT